MRRRFWTSDQVERAPQPAATCRAPSVAMQFSFYGTVHACCENGTNSYGDIRHQTIAEIWNGMPRRAMAAALDAGTYPLGCDLCAVEHPLGNRGQTPAPPFDRFPDGPHEWPRQMEFTLSNRCNLMCIHCNGDNSSAIRSKREGRPKMEQPYGDDFFAQLPPFLDHLEVVAFLGGEPFLAPEARRVWDLLLERGLTPEVQVTTNATVWNERVEHYANRLKMNFAVSIDGATKETYERVREGANFERVLQVRDHMLAAARSYGGYFQLNYCLLPANWHELGRFLLQADELDVVANIIPVFQPGEHSLFSLPADELASVVAALGDEETALRPRLGRNRAAWDTAVGQLRAELARFSQRWDRSAAVASVRAANQTAHAIDRTPAPEPEPASAAAQAEAELRSWSQDACLTLTLVDGIVNAVDPPLWCAPLDPLGWIGRPAEAIAATIAEHVGPVELGAITEVAPGLVRRESVATAAGGPVHFRVVFSERTGRMLMGTRNFPVDAGSQS